MRVRFIAHATVRSVPYLPGQETELPDDVAQCYIAIRQAVALDPPPVRIPPKPEPAAEPAAKPEPAAKAKRQRPARRKATSDQRETR